MAASEHEQRGGRIEGLDQCRPPWLQGKVPSVGLPVLSIETGTPLKQSGFLPRKGSIGIVLPINLGVQPCLDYRMMTMLVTCRGGLGACRRHKTSGSHNWGYHVLCCDEGDGINLANSLRWNTQRRGRAPEIIHHDFDTGCRNSRRLAAAV